MEENIFRSKQNHLYKHWETNLSNTKGNAKPIFSLTGQSKESSTQWNKKQALIEPLKSNKMTQNCSTSIMKFNPSYK